MQNILITGATGLLGAHLLVQLAMNKRTAITVHISDDKDRKEDENQDMRIFGLRRASSNIDEVKRVFSFYGDGWEDLYALIEWR